MSAGEREEGVGVGEDVYDAGDADGGGGDEGFQRWGGGGGGGDDGGGGGDDGGGYGLGGDGFDDGGGEDLPAGGDAYDVDDLPDFANEKNRALNKKIRELKAKRERAETEVRDTRERDRVMQEHLRNVKQELQHTQALVVAKNKEIETEDHLKMLAEREAGRVRQELRRIDAAKEDMQDKLNIAQNHIFTGNERLEAFKASMNWSEEELEQWVLAAKQKEEDNLALQSYTRKDEIRIKELTLQLERLTTEVSRVKASLEEEVTETQAKQIELDKTSEEFRALHRERQALVTQWQDAIAAMKRRDEEIARAAADYATAAASLEARRNELREYQHRLESQQGENAEVQGSITAADRVNTKQREDYQRQQQKLNEFKDEVEVLKNELQKAANDLLQRRTENVNLNADLEAKKEALDASRKRYQATKKRLETSQANADKVEAAAQMHEETLAEREGDLDTTERAIAGIKERLFRATTELFAARAEEANLIAEIAGTQAAHKNLTAKIHKLDQQSLAQQELVYNGEFQIQQLERKVARASGERSDAEKKAMQAKIDTLQAQLDAVTAQTAMLTQQVKRLGDDLRATEAHKKELDETLAAELRTAGEMRLQSASAEAQVKALIASKEEAMVQHDVLKLEVKKLKAALSAKSDEVFGLENRKYQLQMSMEERKRQIEVHREVQRAQLKLAEEERHRVAMELQERLMKVTVLRAKFETLAARVRGSGDAGGEERSQAYFVIKAAQQREELQREGDELDAGIRKCEREIKALVATLKSLNVRNQNYRASFKKADMTSDDARQLHELEQQAKAASDQLFRKRKELVRVQTEMEDDKRRIGQLDDSIEQLRNHIEQMRVLKAKSEKEALDTRGSMERVAKRVHELSAAHRRTAGVAGDEETADEIGFRAQGLRDTNANVLFTLGQLVKEFPEAGGDFTALLRDHGLVVPPRPPSSGVAGRGATRT